MQFPLIIRCLNLPVQILQVRRTLIVLFSMHANKKETLQCKMYVVIIHLKFAVARTHQDTRCRHISLKAWVMWPLLLVVSVGVQSHSKAHPLSCLGVNLHCPGGAEQKRPVYGQLPSVAWKYHCRGESVSGPLLRDKIFISLD